MTDALPEHETVAELRPGRTRLVRDRLTGSLVVVRRLTADEDQARARVRALAPGAGPIALLGVEGALHVARPFVPGEPLAATLGGPRVDAARALALCRALAEALAALHARGAPHGAIHPGNVIVLGDGRVVLTDGVDRPRPLLAEGAVAWTAPEILRGGPASRPADVFAAGAIAYRILAGRVPLEAGDPVEAARRALFDVPLRLALLRPDLPAALCDAVDLALAKSPRRRPAARELARALGAGEPAVALPAVRDRSVAAASVGPPLPGRGIDPGRGRNHEAAVALPAVRDRSAAAASVGPPLPGPLPPPAAGGEGRGIGLDREAAVALPAARDRSVAAASVGPPLPGPLRPPTGGEGRGHLAPGPGRIEDAVRSVARRAWRAAVDAPPLARIALVALPLAVALAAGLPREPAFAREVGERIDAGDLAGARAAIDRAARSAGADPWLEKLRGDLACARGDAGECLRRYAAALEARPGLAGDPRLRAAVLRLVERGVEGRPLVRIAARLDGMDEALVDATRAERHAVRWSAVRILEARGRADRIDYASFYARDLGGDAGCGARRAAAARLAELRDPSALPSLEAARRENGGLGGWLCVGGEVDRALQATRAAADR
jgi:hypothetical protein